MQAKQSSGRLASGDSFNQSDYGYDTMGRENRRKSPGGTIARTIYNPRGQVLSTWIGTDDAGATESDPDGSGGTNNLVKVAESEYDNNAAGGDGNPTKLTLYAGASDTRITSYSHDWRNREVTEDGEIDAYAKTYYDNLGRLIKQERYDTTSGGNLIGRSEMKYDDRGRAYQSITYAVDPSTGTAGNALTSNNWYDASGNRIKSIQAGSGQVFTKSVYDGLGRSIRTYTGYDTDETAYADALTITGDTILSQSENSYDAAGNGIQLTMRERLHDATGEGELTTISGSQPRARVSYTAMWHDGIGRPITSASYGTNADAAFTRPSTVPARSDTVLVTTMEYDDAGRAYKSIDPKAIEMRTTYDHAGRKTKVIEAYDDGDPSTGNADRDRVTEYAYTADGKTKSF